MLDIKFIRENIETVRKAAQEKNIKVDLDRLLKLDDERRIHLQEGEKLRAKKNKASKQIPDLEGDERGKLLQELAQLSAQEKKANEKLKKIEPEYNELMLRVPQITSKKTPVGKDDTQNEELRKEGKLPKFDFTPLDHVTLGEKLDIIDIPRGAKVAGTRNYYLKNEGVELQMAVLKLTLDHLMDKGFSPFDVPVLVPDAPMIGTAYFPGGEEQTYRIEKDELNLIGTSEVSVCSYHSGEILDEKDLPLRYAGISNCFRREAGTYGKDTHGLYRVHQFQKVEQVVVCKATEKESEKMFDELLTNAEEILQKLELPYRVVSVCTGDIGQGQAYKNDIETWMPSRESYGETHSCSMFFDFQARRLNLRYRDKKGNIQYCYTLNNTCIASPRILIPLLECYQQKDGSVKIPAALQPYMRGKTVIERRIK